MRRHRHETMLVKLPATEPQAEVDHMSRVEIMETEKVCLRGLSKSAYDSFLRVKVRRQHNLALEN